MFRRTKYVSAIADCDTFDLASIHYLQQSLQAIDFTADVLRELNFFAGRTGEVVGDYSDPCHLVWHGEEVHRLRSHRVTVETPATLCGTVNEFLD